MPLKKRKVEKLRYQPEWLAEPYNTARGETALWVAVITQAMMDALSRARNAEAAYHKHEARHWLTEGGADFATVCYCAGFDPAYVRRKAKRVLARPRRWRAAPGKGARYVERKAYRQQLKKKAHTVQTEPQTAKIIIL